MKVIILAGGLGTRLSEETDTKPKPMVLIGDKPILWHIMNIYAQQGFRDFVIATGYKGQIIHEWISNGATIGWNVRALDTGRDTMTSGRVRQCMEYVGDETVLVTYGDGLGNIQISKLIDFHRSENRLATVTAVRPPARFGVLESENGRVTHFGEKNQTDAGWINGGFFVLEPGVKEYLGADNEPFETSALPKLTQLGSLSAFHHDGFWQPMDTLRERNLLTQYSSLTPMPWLVNLTD
jgi:glucose-1-phosphate cytidylyltransferase